jgi:hypothetical protein
MAVEGQTRGKEALGTRIFGPVVIDILVVEFTWLKVERRIVVGECDKYP